MHVTKDCNAICKIGGILVSWGFYNKVQHTEWLKPQKFVVSQFGKIEVPDQGVISWFFLMGVRKASVTSLSPDFCSMLAIFGVS